MGLLLEKRIVDKVANSLLNELTQMRMEGKMKMTKMLSLKVYPFKVKSI